MKVNSIFIETLRFTFTRRIKGADGKTYKHLPPQGLPFGSNRDNPHLSYATYMLSVWSQLWAFANPFAADSIKIILIVALIFMPLFRFLSYYSAIKGGCDVWECDTVPKFGHHPFVEAFRGTFLFRCKDAEGKYHRLSLVKFGLPTLLFIPVLIGETFIFQYVRHSEMNRFIMLAIAFAPILLYYYLLKSYGTICNSRSEWLDVNAPDDTEGGSEYKL